MSTFKKKINYSTHDTTASLLLNATTSRTTTACCAPQLPRSGVNYKKYINTLEKTTILKDAQIKNDQNVPCCNLRCCSNN